MMKRVWGMGMSLVLLLTLAVFTHAAARVAVVDTAKVFKEYEKTKDAKTRLEKEIEDKREELAEKNKKLEKMKSDLDTQKGIVSESKYKKLEEKYEAERDLFREEYRGMQETLMKKQQTLMEGILNDIKAICEKIAKREKYELVLDKETALYYNGDDITFKILDELNKQ